MSKLKIVGNSEGLGTFTIISPNSDSNATIELPHSTGNLFTDSQHLIPSEDEVYDLGSSSKAFKDLHISASTIFLGTQPIRATSSGIVVPEIQIGEGTSAVKLKASDDGKLKQVSTDSAGADLPEVDIPQKLIDLTDVLDTAPTQGQTLIWNNTTSKFEFSIVPEVFSDFTDVDTVTTPPTDTQVLTWSDANTEWSAGNNGFPLIVANTTELLALTGMLVGQEAFVTDLNRSYTYTGSTPNDKWRHAVSGWYATDNVMTNHPMTEITGIDSAYSLSSTGSLVTITAAADDPDQKPISWVIDTIQNGADVNFNQTDNVLVISQLPSEGSPTSPIDILATFKAYDDSLDPIFFTTTISAFRIFSRVGWEDGTMIFDWGYSVGPDYLGHGKSIDLSSDGSTLIVSDAYWNKALIYDKTVDDTWVKTPGQEGTQFPTFASELYIYQPMGITEEFPNGQYDAMGMSYLTGNGPAELFHPGGIYGASIQTRFGYAGRTVALSADGLTAAVACTGETIGADIWEPNGSEELPYVDIFNRDPITRIWTRVAHKLSPSAYDPTATTWIGDDGGHAIRDFNITTDLNKPPSTWHSGSRGAGSGGVIVPPAGMTIALSKGGTTLVVGYRLEGPKLTPHNQYADKSEIQLSVDQMAEWGPASAPFISIYRDLPSLDHSTGAWHASGGHQTLSGSTLNQDSPIMRPAGVYSNLTGTSTGGIASNVRPDGGSSGNGTGGVYTVTIVAGVSLGIDYTYATVEVVEWGTGHEVGDVITISDSKVGGSGKRDIQMIVESVKNDIINVPNSTPDINLYNWGAVYIYEKDSNNNWSLDTKISGGIEAGSFGAAVDIAGEIDGGVDTRRIVVSTPNINGGLAQVFEKTDVSGTAWQARSGIYPPDYFNNAVNKTNNRFGFNSISISKDGTKIAVGDPGQSVTNVIETTTSYGAGSTKKNQGGIVSSTNEFTSNFTYPAGVVYVYEKTGTSNQWFQGDTDSDTWELQTNGIIENFIGVSGDGFGDRVDLNFDGSILAVGAPYEHNGFYFPGAYVGAKYINEYSAKRVFYGWYRFSHGGGTAFSRPDTSQPARSNELDTWNYTEATEAITCTVNSVSYVGFVTPADGKVDAYDLSVSFTSVGTDDDVVSIVLAFNVDSNGKEHTISLIRSGNKSYPTQYLYAIVYNFAMPDESTIFDGNSLITDNSGTGHGGWNNKFVRNRIVRSGDTFTVTTSQAIDPSNHNGTNSQLDSSTTHTFSLGSYSFGNLFSAANGGARWGFSCMSQNDSSWVNVELADAINPEEISDTGAVHVYQRNLLDSWDKTNRFYPSITTHTCIPDSSGFLGMDCSSSNPVQKLTDCHFGRLALSDDAKVLVSGYKKNASGKSHHTGSDLGRFEIFGAPFSQNPPSPITLSAPYTGFTTLGTPVDSNGIALPNNGINYALPHSTVVTATSTDPEGGDITWHGAITSGDTDPVNGGYVTGGTTITLVDGGDGSVQFTFLTPAHAPQHTFTWTIYATDTSGQTTNSTITYEWKYPVVSSNSMVFYESEPGGENSTNIPNTHTNVKGTDYNWTCPPDVYYVHALCVGGGACNTSSGIGGGGGGLGWKNNIPVVPGQTYPLKVGRGGHGNSNAHSYFISQSTVKGGGGSGSSGGTYIGDGGGNGGAGSILAHGTSTGGCGGGAGGYSGNGGNGSPSAVGVNFPTGVNGSSGSGGGGGGGAHNYGQYATGGGGVGINGQGSSGSGGVWASSTLGATGAAGRGGSAGQNGESNLGAGSGGDFGGGGSGRSPGSSGDAGGGDGVVKLIWGTGNFGNPNADNAPQWPSTNIPQTNPQFQTDAQKGI